MDEVKTVLKGTKPSWQFHKAISSIAEFLPFDELLKCRSVCKQWKQDVDTYIQCKPDYSSKEGKYSYKFTSTGMIRQFLECFADHPGNPLVVRSVKFSNLLNEPDFAEEVDAFMTQFGGQVWNLYFERYDMQPVRLYDHLHHVLTKGTGLKHLQFDGVGLDWAGDGVAVAGKAMSANFLKRPLPFIPSLESPWFRVADCHSEIESLVMLPYATQLKSFSMNMQGWQDHFARGLINLKELVLKDITSNETLGKLMGINSPIEKISLSFGGRLSLRLVMEVLGKFPLREVTLLFGPQAWVDQPDGEEVAAAVLARIRLPKVKKLYISQGNNFSYNFLKCFPNLESLTVETMAYLGGKSEEEDMEQETEEDVQFYKMFAEEEGLHESNVWKKMPKLESVHIFDSTLDDMTGTGVPLKLFDVNGSRVEYEQHRSQGWSQICKMFAE